MSELKIAYALTSPAHAKGNNMGEIIREGEDILEEDDSIEEVVSDDEGDEFIEEEIEEDSPCISKSLLNTMAIVILVIILLTLIGLAFFSRS